jgi:hypothetical protein
LYVQDHRQYETGIAEEREDKGASKHLEGGSEVRMLTLPSITMVANKHIKKGEEIFISYINESMSYSDRQEKLKEMYFFECKCEKCRYRW